MFSRFYLLWCARYQHLTDFSHFQKCDNYVISLSNVWISFQDSNLSEPGQIYPDMSKNQPSGSSSFFNHFCTYKHIYTHIHILYLRFNRIDILICVIMVYIYLYMFICIELTEETGTPQY